MRKLNLLENLVLTECTFRGITCYICEGERLLYEDPNNHLIINGDNIIYIGTTNGYVPYLYYEIRHGDDIGKPLTLEKHVTVNYYGFMLMEIKYPEYLDIQKQLKSISSGGYMPYIPIGEDDINWGEEKVFVKTSDGYVLKSLNDDHYINDRYTSNGEETDVFQNLFKIYFDDLNEEAQKAFLEYANLSSPEEGGYNNRIRPIALYNPSIIE